MSVIQGMVVGLVTNVDRKIPGQVKVHFTASKQAMRPIGFASRRPWVAKIAAHF